MFSVMIDTLRAGDLPQEMELTRRLQLAIVKKLGMLQGPYLCRSSDPKINPSATHLLWAAILLGDEEKVRLAADCIQIELQERPSSRGVVLRQYLAEVLAELASLANGAAVGQAVGQRVARAKEWLGLA